MPMGANVKHRRGSEKRGEEGSLPWGVCVIG